MTIWMSGELQLDIDQPYMAARAEIEEAVNSAISAKEYGGGVVEWALIPIIMDPGKGWVYREIKKYSKAKRETEFRLQIDYKSFRTADDMEQRRLVFAMILRSIEEGRRLNIPVFDLDGFEKDIRDVGIRKGWA